MVGRQTVFDAIAETTTTELYIFDGLQASAAAGALLLEVLGGTSANFTLDIQGKVHEDGTYTNIDYVQIYQAGAAALSNSQLTVNDQTVRFYLLPIPPPLIQLIATYTAGDLTVHASYIHLSFSLPSAISATGAFAVQGSIAHDAVDADNPVGQGLNAQEDISTVTDVAVGDRVRAIGTRKGATFVAFGPPDLADAANAPASVITESDGERALGVTLFSLAPDGSFDRLRTLGDTVGTGLGVLITAPEAVQAEVNVTKALAAAGDYAAEDVLSESASSGTAWTFSAVLPNNADRGYVVKAIITSETTGLTPRLTMYLFNAATTGVVNDNAVNDSILNADISQYVGRIDWPAMEDLGGNSEAIATPSISGNLPMAFQTASDANDLIGILVTRDAITGEVAGDDMTIKLTIEKA